MSTGQLLVRVRAYEREKTWAPAYVANELAGTRQAADRHRHEATVRRAEAEHAGLRVDVEPYLARPATLLDESEEIVAVATSAAEAVTGAVPERRLRGPMDDTGSLIAAGVPAVSFGLGAANLAAGPDAPVGEWISLPELPRLAETYVEVARRFCA